MLSYNTKLRKLILPEYGRNIQQMVDHCLTIEDREERNHCARAIIATMKTVFPDGEDNDVNRRKLWDHLAIMSDFQLDIDWPFEAPEHIGQTAPEKVPYLSHNIRYRHYGRIMQDMIDKVSHMTEGEERDELIDMLSNHMKKLLSSFNKDVATDKRIYRDLKEYSHGEIDINPEERPLHEFQIVEPVTGKKKKKK